MMKTLFSIVTLSGALLSDVLSCLRILITLNIGTYIYRHLTLSYQKVFYGNEKKYFSLCQLFAHFLLLLIFIGKIKHKNKKHVYYQH